MQIVVQHLTAAADRSIVTARAPFHPTPSILAPDPQDTPERMGEYELLERVGRGASAEVWLARRAVMAGGLKPCALKIIHHHIAAHPRHRRMFLQEGRLALKMSHGNVVSMFDVGEADGRLYMALEWIDGVSLFGFAQRVREREGNLSIGEVCYVVAQILEGLRYAHGLQANGRPLGVIHRDIAPHNVLISGSGEVKLGDFGIARVCGELSSGEHIKGRTRYMAPEQLRGEPSQASDLYSVGAILHELLEGRRFREGHEQGEGWHRMITEAPILPLHRDQVPAPLEALRVGLLQPDPRNRIATAELALRTLLDCPPWTAGAEALRGRYARCMGLPRRTGLTRPHMALPRAEATPRATASMPTIQPRQPTAPRPSSPALPMVRPPSGPVSASFVSTATMRPAHLSATDNSTPASAARRVAAVARRHRRPSLLHWLSRGLWGLAGVFGLMVVALCIPKAVGTPCIEENSVAPATRARVRVRGDGTPHAQVRIDMQVVAVEARAECFVSPGVHDMAWRPSPNVPWSSVGPQALIPAKEHLVRLSEDGLAISAYDP